VDRAGTVTFINNAAQGILGLESESEILDGLAQATLHPTDLGGRPLTTDRCPLHGAYLSGQSVSGIETAFHHRDGRLIPVECTVQPLLLDGQRLGSVVAFRDMSEHRSLEARIQWQATHDPLTELHNRGYFEEQLEVEVRRLQRAGGQGGLLHIDLDQFRYLNEASGHQAGDRLLAEIGSKLRGYVRHSDLLARLDGDEFAVLLRNLRPEQIVTVAEGLRDDLQSCGFEADGKHYRISASIGVSLLHQGVTSAGALIAEADGACQVAKRKGRNQVHVFDPLSDNPAARDEGLGWTHRLGNALRDHLFVVYYQPVMAMDDIDVRHLSSQPGRLWAEQKSMHEHYEVLLRLRGDHGEMISPQVFVPIAERFNLMPEIDLWVVGQVLDRLRSLQREGRDGVVLSLNLSAKTLGTPAMLPRMRSLLGLSGIDPARLIFEVTETSEIDDLDVAQRFIQELRSLGYRFALDDFGTGFCSFSQVKHLPADIVKVDGHFVQGMAKDAIDGSIVTAINDIAHSLGLLTVAEHVESAEVLRLLKACGIDYVQGHYIAQPSPELVPSGTGRSTTPLRLVHQPGSDRAG
jgi:diguanylate cyclase (GGDEF)-like protein/PAS domain S-box-containing protein